MKNPNRNVPLASMIGTMMVTIIYTLTNIAYLAVLNPTEMLSSSAVAISFGNRTLGVLAWIMPLSVVCSTFGGINGSTFTQARLIFVGARRGHVPEAFSLLHATRYTPIPAVVLSAVLCLLMLSTSNVVILINYATFSSTLTFFGCMCALICFRYKQPQKSRPFKVWLPLPIAYSVVQVFLMVLPLIANPVEVGVSIGVVATGLPLYFAIYRKDIAEVLSKPLQKLTRLCQLVFMVVAEEKMD